MSFCIKCGKELSEDSAFCSACGTPTTQTDIPTEQNSAEKQNFLELTHRLLRWEKTAWKIIGIITLVLGIFYSSIFLLLVVVGLAEGGYDGMTMAGVGIIYGMIFGGLFLAMGIVSLIAAKKIQKHLDTLYTDFRPTYDRCSSIGMLILAALFNEIALVFFLINFIRMKTNKALAEKCMAVSSSTT